MKVATPEEVQRNSDRNSPWGKPGAGAPLKENDGSIVKNTKGRMQHESLGYSKTEEETMERAKRIYRDELIDGIERQKLIREEEKSYLRLPPGDVPSWFSKGKVGRPKRDPVTGMIVPQKRMMSDVTAQKFNTDRPRDAEKYYQDLQKMAEERYKKRMEEKQRIIQQELKHIDTADSYFEHPEEPHDMRSFVKRRRSSKSLLFPSIGKIDKPPRKVDHSAPPKDYRRVNWQQKESEKDEHQEIVSSSPSSFRKSNRLFQDVWDDTKLFGYNASHGNLNESLNNVRQEPTSFARVNRIQNVQFQNGQLDYRGVQPKNLSTDRSSFGRKNWSKLDRWEPKELENEDKTKLYERVLKARERRMNNSQQSEYEASFDTKQMEKKSGPCKPLWCACRKSSIYLKPFPYRVVAPWAVDA